MSDAPQIDLQSTHRLRAENNADFIRVANNTKKYTKIVIAILVLGGAMISGFFGVFEDGFSWPLKSNQIGILLGVVLAFIGGIFLLITQEDNIEHISKTKQALDAERKASEVLAELYDLLDEYEITIKKIKNLYDIYNVSRSIIEKSLRLKEKNELDVIAKIMKISKQPAIFAAGYEVGSGWTIGVYKTLIDEKGYYLKCVYTVREVDCEIDKARSFRIGEGVGGQALLQNREVVMPDLASTDSGDALRPSGNNRREDDVNGYRSLFAVPVTYGPAEPPWGVVVGSNSNPHHFQLPESRDADMQPEEVIRALANIIALAVGIFQVNDMLENPDNGPEQGSEP